MSDIVILKEMIKTTAVVPLEAYHSKNKVTLEEPPPAGYSVTIYGMPDDDQTIVIKADAFTAPKDIFATPGHNLILIPKLGCIGGRENYSGKRSIVSRAVLRTSVIGSCCTRSVKPLSKIWTCSKLKLDRCKRRSA